jgi:hypothetical protein
MRKMRLLMSSTSQSKPSCRPSPDIALQPRIFQCRPEMSSLRRSRASAICSKLSAPPRSCLFANISRLDPASFYTTNAKYSGKYRWHFVPCKSTKQTCALTSWVSRSFRCILHSSNLHRSTESTTQIMPSVCSK